MRALVASLALCLAPWVARADPPPPLVLWAWERPEDLRFAPPGVGVAYLRATVEAGPAGARVRARRQPLFVREGAWRMAVVRVELRPRGATLTPEAQARAPGMARREELTPRGPDGGNPTPKRQGHV